MRRLSHPGIEPIGHVVRDLVAAAVELDACPAVTLRIFPSLRQAQPDGVVVGLLATVFEEHGTLHEAMSDVPGQRLKVEGFGVRRATAFGMCERDKAGNTVFVRPLVQVPGDDVCGHSRTQAGRHDQPDLIGGVAIRRWVGVEPEGDWIAGLRGQRLAGCRRYGFLSRFQQRRAASPVAPDLHLRMAGTLSLAGLTRCRAQGEFECFVTQCFERFTIHVSTGVDVHFVGQHVETS